MLGYPSSSRSARASLPFRTVVAGRRGGQRLTPEERERVREFLLHLADWSGKPWDELIYLAGVPSTTAAGWRYKRSTPQAPALLDLLRAAGVLDDEYKLR